MDILASDLVLEIWPPRPQGGQHVGTSSRGVRITHVPTGMVAISETERSQHRNREVAMDMLRGGLTSPAFSGG